MRTTTLATLICLAGALAGCGYVPSGSAPGSTVEFVAANADSVLLDFNANVKGELDASRDIATQQCGIFHRGAANLESLNVRTPGTIRATYRCGA
jgi:hypothetical protein